MRCGKLVIGLGMGAMLSACWGGYGYGYHRRGYYNGAYSTGVVYSQPVAQPQPVIVQGQVGQPVQPQVMVAGEGIGGSDGSRGWRVGSQSPDQDFQRFMQSLGRMNCQVEASTQVEFKAVCNGAVHVIVRFDQQNVYKLCAPNTDPAACSQVWGAVQ
jgi:hypothetical protein